MGEQIRMEEAAAPYTAPKQITYENTFITEPEGYGEVNAGVFFSIEFPTVLLLVPFSYSIPLCSNMCSSGIKYKRC